MLAELASHWLNDSSISPLSSAGPSAGNESQLVCAHTFVETGNEIRAAALAPADLAAISASATGEVQARAEITPRPRRDRAEVAATTTPAMTTRIHPRVQV